jgi:transposase
MRDYERAYEEQLRGFRREQLEDGRPAITNQQQLIVASLVERGENVNYIAQILDIRSVVIIRWHRNLFLNAEQAMFGSGDMTYIRDKNVVRPDARTIGNIIKAIEEEVLTEEQAADAVGKSLQAVKKWRNEFLRDYEVMRTLPAGGMYSAKPPYSLNRDDMELDQALIWENDRAESELASRRREANVPVGDI